MKGNGIMDYLMAYGWVLLVIILVGAAFFALGLLDPATYQDGYANNVEFFCGHYNGIYSGLGECLFLKNETLYRCAVLQVNGTYYFDGLCEYV